MPEAVRRYSLNSPKKTGKRECADCCTNQCMEFGMPHRTGKNAM